MTSFYLEKEASEKRLSQMRKRIASEAICDRTGNLTWDAESDFWMLPKPEQEAITEIVSLTRFCDL